MRLLFLLSLSVLTLTLSGCTEDADGLNAPTYTGPKAEIWYTDVTQGDLNGGTDDFVECGTSTHLYVEYIASENPIGENESDDFTVNVQSQSSRSGDNETGYQGIPVWPQNEAEGRFPGNETGEFETDISGTAGMWKLNVQRSAYHTGQFLVRLTCN